MNCPVCGAPLNPGDGFCGSCGADVSSVSSPSVQPPASAYPAPARPKSGLSAGAIIGIVVGVLALGLVVVGGGGLLAFRAYTSGKTVTTSAPEPAAVETVAPEPAVETTTPAADGVVTEAEARTVVTQFLDTRIAGDIEGSKAFCSQNMLTGENGEFVSDQYWAPDSYTITRTTPDLMYVHVTTMGAWPSGEEPTIYSVVRDPESGKVLIDGMLDPEYSTELWQ